MAVQDDDDAVSPIEVIHGRTLPRGRGPPQPSGTSLADVFHHIVLLELQPDTPDDAVDELVDALRRLPDAIEAIRTYRVGRDAGLAADNATVAVVAGFDDEDGFVVYRDHPAHQAVIAELIRPRLVRRSALQHHD